MKTKRRAKVSRAGGAKRIEAHVAALERELSETKEYLAAVRLIESKGGKVSLPKKLGRLMVGKSARPRIPAAGLNHALRPTATPKGNRLTWFGEMRRVLEEQTSGISYADLLAQLTKGPLGENRSEGNKGFYQAIRRLTKMGEVVKSGNLLYTTRLAKTLKSNGHVLPVRHTERGGSGSIILGILDQNPNGLSGPELKEKAGKHPDAPESMRTHPQFIYNVLWGLKKTGRIRKQGGKYFSTQAEGANKSQAVH